MINKIKDIPDGTEVWVKMKRVESYHDGDMSIQFDVAGEEWDYIYLNDTNEVLTEEQMRERFSDKVPKQGDEIEVRTYGIGKEWIIKKASHTALITDDGKPYALGQWRFPPKKIQKTLAELEKELGYDEGTLEITN